VKFQQLRSLLAVVDAGSITEAARRLNVTQPALSAGLAALETELGGALIERQRGSVRLTDLGRRFHRRAQGIMQECERAKAEFQRGLARSFVNMGVLATFPMAFILDFLRRFKESNPKTDVSFDEGDPMTLLSWMSRGRVDAALTVSDMVDGGEWVPLFQDPLVLFCAPSHRFAGESSIRLADLAGEPFVLRRHCERAREANDILNARGVRVASTLRTDQDQRALEAVRAGVGVTVAPRSLARDVECVLIDDLGLRRTVGVHMASWLEPGVRDAMVATLEEIARPFADTMEGPAKSGETGRAARG
jgi:DNA-binding transcriptional LysR family regulator